MLARTRLSSAARLSPRFSPALSRNFCAPVVPLADQIKIDVEALKEKIADKTVVGYTPEAYSAAFAAGKVDPSLLSETLSFSDELRKMTLKINTSTMGMLKEMEAGQEADFSKFEGKLDSDVMAEVKAIFEKSLAEAQADSSEADRLAVTMKEIDGMFNGPDGLLAKAAVEEKRAEAGLLKAVADYEKLIVDVEGVRDVTIAEILEREPELRAKVEEEIANNVWAP